MSVPANCISGYRIAARTRGTHGSLKPRSSFFNLRVTPVLQHGFHLKQFEHPVAGIQSLAHLRPLNLQQRIVKVQSTAITRHASHAAAEPYEHDEEIPTSPPFSAGPYSNLTIGVPKESYPGERRVAITPQNVKLLLKKGFSRILVERGAGAEAQFTDEAYEQAGAKTVDRRSVFSEADIVLKVRPLSVDGEDSEVDAIREGATVISFLYPVQNKHVVDRIASRKATAFAMDMVPRISRAQVFDALRSASAYLNK